MEILAPKFVIRLSLKFLGINIYTPLYMDVTIEEKLRFTLLTIRGNHQGPTV